MTKALITLIYGIEFIILFIVLPSGLVFSMRDCSDPDKASGCDSSINISNNSIAYNIKPSMVICELALGLKWRSIDPNHSQTIRCPDNGTRIMFTSTGCTTGLLQQLVLENCLIYWKDLASLQYYSPSWILILDNCMDEFATGEIDYFYACRSSPSFLNKYVDDLHVFSSGARPVSEAFTSKVLNWPNTKRASFNG